MLRAIRTVLGITAILFGSTLLAQPPKDAPQADGYFPLKVKSRWIYKIGENEIRVEVTKTEKVGGEEHFQVDTFVTKDPKSTEPPKTSEMYVIKADGVYRTKVKDDKLDPYVKVLPLPVKKDATWEVNSKVGTQAVKGTMKIMSEKEKVKTPAGDFDTVFVEGKDMDIAGAKTTVRIWFAKDHGIVKQEFVLQTNDTVKIELGKYEPAK